MSGYNGKCNRHNGTLDAGVRLLQKPFTLRELKNKVREVLDSIPAGRDADVPVVVARDLAAQGTEQVPLSRAPVFKFNCL